MNNKFETKSENRDVQDIAKLCDEIAREDWYYGPLESKLQLIIMLAERASQSPVFKSGHNTEGK